MKLRQNDLEILIDKLERGEITADQANVEKVRIKRVQLVTTKFPSSVRKALNEAVKAGYLGHMPKKQHKPEVYYHPTFEYLAKHERNMHEQSIIDALRGVYA